MTLNGVMAVTLRYFTEFGNNLCSNRYNRVDVAEFMRESTVFWIACTMSS